MNTVEKIFFLLRERGIEQKQFAIDIGVSQQAVSEWKSGKTQSYRKHIDKIADYFNVSTDYLLAEDYSFPNNYSNNNLSHSKNVAFGENSTVNESDIIMSKFIQEFKQLEFADMVKAMNYVVELKNKEIKL